MNKPSTYLLLAALVMISVSSPGQYYYFNEKYYEHDVVIETGVTGGVMNCLTDLGGKRGIGRGFIKDLNMTAAKPASGLYLAGTYKNALVVRLEGTFGTLQGYDSILEKVAPSTFGRYERNLSFKSHVSEAQLAVEVHPLFFKYYADGDAPYWSPYIIAGVGVFNFNPQASLNGQWYALHPLRTEGQGFAEYPGRKKYSLTQLNIPLGIGVKYELGTFFVARLEIVHRILFTDYLDDVSTGYINPGVFNNYLPAAQAALARQLSDRRKAGPRGEQRGDSKNNDAYFSIQVKLGFTIRTARMRRSWVTACR